MENEDIYPEKENKKSKWLNYIFFIIITFFLLFGLSSYFFLSPPSDFPKNKTFTVQNGDTLKVVSMNLKKEKVIRSAISFQTFSIILGNENMLKAGDYLFEKPMGLIEIAKRILTGKSGFSLSKVTIPEGSTNKDMAKILANSLNNFDQTKFLILAQDKEGYLFPDTYFFNPNISPEKVIGALTSNFSKKLDPLKSEIESSGKSLKDIIIMASILEKEAFGEEDIYTISGILWSRIQKNMPLQTDATITYITGKTSKEMTLSDLDIDSKFNTYKYKGLPIAPIGNPGILGIKASLRPEKTDFLYYLHSSDGKAYFGRNFDEHKKNKSLYLK